MRSIESFWGWPNNKALSKLIKCLSAERKGSLGLDIGLFFQTPPHLSPPATRLYQSRLRQRLKCAILWGVAQALRLPILLFDMRKQRKQRQSPNNHRPSQQVCLSVCPRVRPSTMIEVQNLPPKRGRQTLLLASCGNCGNVSLFLPCTAINITKGVRFGCECGCLCVRV